MAEQACSCKDYCMRSVNPRAASAPGIFCKHQRLQEAAHQRENTPPLPWTHADHGRGTLEQGPDDPDCPCRGTPEQRACAKEGCGFCYAAEHPR